MEGNVTIQELKTSLHHLRTNLDVFFLVTMGTVIFFMQCGFAFLEAGSVRSKNTTNILIKNILDVFIGGIAYWLVGYALAFGQGNGFSGESFWALYGLKNEVLALWFFHFVFAATSATIVSGSMAERCAFGAYLIYSVMLTGVVYPIVSHWAWSGDGWLAKTDYQDFAGSGVVHLTGGVAALVGAAFLGPRHGRFGPDGRELRGHSVPLAALGGFILLFGFLAFNGGSQGSISQKGDAAAVAKAIVNSVIAGCCGGVTVLLVYRTKLCGPPFTWSFLMALNGALAGMVSICAGCNVMHTWGSGITGVVSGLIFLLIHKILPLLRVDDPLDAVAVHLGGGLWGLVAVGLFAEGGIMGNVLKWNMLGALSIIAWSGGFCTILFGLLRLLGWLRVSLDMEVQGMDILKHGEPAYPAEAWEETQYTTSMANGDNTNRNQYLPPNMTPWTTPNWGNYNPHKYLPHLYCPPYPPYYPHHPGLAVNWTLPNPRRNAHYHEDGVEGGRGRGWGKNRSPHHHSIAGATNEAFEAENSKL